MKNSTSSPCLQAVWSMTSDYALTPFQLLYLVFCGFFLGLASGTIVAILRITAAWAYSRMLVLSASSTGGIVLLFVLCLLAALLAAFLSRNPAIRFGGSAWEEKALLEGQPHPWRIILIPKFIGILLVMSMGVSVGHGTPSIQIGAAAAMGFDRSRGRDPAKRRCFILGGCATGLDAAFCAPFTGICYVYEVMKQKLDPILFAFLLSGSFGVFIAQFQFFGMSPMLPFTDSPLPYNLQFLWLLPLGLFAGLAGIAYNLALNCSIRLYARQKLLSPCLKAIVVFMATGLMLLIFPAVTGESLGIFNLIQKGQALLGYLCLFLLVKLLLTAFCYGSGIPAGVMVPLICIGGVSGGIFASCLVDMGMIAHELVNGFIVMGMAGAYASAERAPVTAMVLVLEMTGTWETVPGMLLVSAIGAFCGRLARLGPI